MASSTSKKRTTQQKETLSKVILPPEVDSASMEEDHSVSDSKDDEDVCPLFMEGLPRDFSQNPQLAALASLLDEDSEDDDVKKIKSTEEADATPQKGGGKVKSQKSRNGRRTSPYPEQTGKKSKEDKTSMGEAQLFMKMWKL